MNKLSIKRKLLIYNILIQTIILVVLSLSIYKTLHISTLDKIETSLKVIILDIVDDISEHQDNLSEIDFDEEKEYKFKPLYVRLIDKNLKIVKSTTFPDEIPINHKNIKLEIIDFQEYENFIVGEIKFSMLNNPYILQVATNYKILNETMQNLFYILIFIIPIILIFSITGGYFLIYKSFNPIEEILENLREINSTTLSKRLLYSKREDEIDMLAKEINSLLERLEISFDKINQFSSDASHELKTPLTIIRGEIEIALRKDREKEEYKTTLQSCLDEVLIIQQTIDDLLFLAKEESSEKSIHETIYVDELTLEAAKELKPFAKIKNIEIKIQINDIFQIEGHNKLLKIGIKNILKNAIIYSHEASSVTVKNSIENDNFVITIEDKGIGISKEDQTKIFEKFYRTDKSRNKESGGTGLGMSIVEKIAKLHGAKIELESQEKVGTTVKLIFKRDINE
ncbi:sensor histidine kinase [Halarcobacter ebronensis]|uniref:histidine kinase n=1 Tax=Halarcobacter ebronensis TaxID=1462615 RepID=A0A4V1M0T7_9BACT|nr:HAMP domain-containing sensor histidine kinase [Halarcobacter ebronensis]QKF83496.1 two-component system sensor histidine kinase [Halarcobacter ebronensis]RXK08290.1 two-component sensor histidine kinase [Halarcobacter ebronensis]